MARPTRALWSALDLLQPPRAMAKGGRDRLMDAVTAAHDGDIQMIDSTSVRAHQPAEEHPALETLL